MNDGGGKLCREPAPVDSARVHEAVERILAERHGGALEMHLRGYTVHSMSLHWMFFV